VESVWRPEVQLHLSLDAEFNPETAMVNAQNADDRAFVTKPAIHTGLWTSTYNRKEKSSEWVEWCISQDFGNVYEQVWWLLTPRHESRIYTIDGLRDLEVLMARYPYNYKHRLSVYEYMALIDFEKMSEEWDGIHLTSRGNMKLHYSFPHNLNSWDVESTIWFRWSFTKCERIETPVRVKVAE
jgi:hypothetical protein